MNKEGGKDAGRESQLALLIDVHDHWEVDCNSVKMMIFLGAVNDVGHNQA